MVVSGEIRRNGHLLLLNEIGMIRVSKLHLEKVGPFKGQTFTFEHQAGEPDIHILTGVNGCGKTTVLHAIAAMFDVFPINSSGEYLNNQFTRRMDLGSSWNDSDQPSFVRASICDRVDPHYEQFVEIGRIVRGKVLNKRRPHPQTSATVPGFEVLDSRAQDELLPEAIRSRISKYCLPHQSNYPIREFAAFAYSANHLVTRTQVNIGSEHEFDPLEDALIFDKSPNSKAAFSTWVAAAEARAGYEIGRGNLDLAKRHRDSVIKLKKALNQLMDEAFDESKYEENKAVFDFDIDTNPWGLAAQINGKMVEFDVMADGLRSILGWLGDLLMRLDRIKWENQEIPVNEQHFLLLLDEIEVHLHPRWQHQLLPMIHELFPNAQIFLTTHSPFIINSIDGAKVYQLVAEEGIARLQKVTKSETGYSYQYVFRTMLGVFNQFGFDTVRDLAEFEGLDKEIARKNFQNERRYIELTKKLMSESAEVANLVGPLVKRHVRISNKDYLHGGL